MLTKIVLLFSISWCYAFNIELDWTYALNNQDYDGQERESYFGYTVGLVTTATSAWWAYGCCHCHSNKLSPYSCILSCFHHHRRLFYFSCSHRGLFNYWQYIASTVLAISTFINTMMNTSSPLPQQLTYHIIISNFYVVISCHVFDKPLPSSLTETINWI